MGLEKCADVVGNPDQTNITYEKHFRGEPDVDSLLKILSPIAEDLLRKQTNYPLTIIYIPLKWCGFAYKIFESVLGSNQYFPAGSLAVPENRLFAQFHSPQTEEMKDEILKQLCSSKSTVRVVFATVALGMGLILKIYGLLSISPHHIPSRHIFKKQAGLGEMDSQQLQFCTTTIATSVKIKKESKKQFGPSAKASHSVLDVYC